MKKDSIICKDLPIDIALAEAKLNITEQYNRTLAFLLIDTPLMEITHELSLQMLKGVF